VGTGKAICAVEKRAKPVYHADIFDPDGLDPQAPMLRTIAAHTRRQRTDTVPMRTKRDSVHQ
jgi:hypothetical protein